MFECFAQHAIRAVVELYVFGSSDRGAAISLPPLNTWPRAVHPDQLAEALQINLKSSVCSDRTKLKATGKCLACIGSSDYDNRRRLQYISSKGSIDSNNEVAGKSSCKSYYIVTAEKHLRNLASDNVISFL